MFYSKSIGINCGYTKLVSSKNRPSSSGRTGTFVMEIIDKVDLIGDLCFVYGSHTKR